VGILGTPGTITSQSYPLEIGKIFPDITVTGEACPMWVPLVENGEYDKPGADYFIRKNLENNLDKDSQIDTLILACTHYPLLEKKIRAFLPANIELVSQGQLVTESLADYLHRHPEMDENCSKNGICRFVTTESEEKFAVMASLFLDGEIKAEHISLKNGK
jgi:glutamate racemase